MRTRRPPRRLPRVCAIGSVSKEEPATDNHDIVPDGYNIGRNELVAAATGTTSYGGVTYSTVAQNITGLMPAGSAGVNPGASLAVSRFPGSGCTPFVCSAG